MAKHVVLGASPNQTRFSFKAVKALLRNDFEAVPVGKREGEIQGIKILTGKPEIEDVYTIILYLGADNQPEYYEYILGLNPGRIIFNPGTYNQELEDLAREKGIETVRDCALIMLNSDTY